MGRFSGHLTKRQRRATRWSGALIVVLLMHGLVLFAASRSTPVPASYPPPLIDVVLFTPPPEPPPPPPEPEDPAPEVGGGAPAAPSRVHRPPEPPPEVEREIIAPPEPAPEPAPELGIAPAPTPQPGPGLGGQGTGTGTGSGDGYGPGSGSTRARPVRGPTIDQIRNAHPRNARSQYGRVELSCIVRLDERLEDCRVVSETPRGRGFGEAALPLARFFRVVPPTRNGVPQSGERFTVGIDFGRPR